MVGQKHTGHTRVHKPHRAQSASAERDYPGKGGLVSTEKKGLGVRKEKAQAGTGWRQVASARGCNFRRSGKASQYADRMEGMNLLAKVYMLPWPWLLGLLTILIAVVGGILLWENRRRS